MVRTVATFIAVWLAVGAIGVVVQTTIMPVPATAISLVGLVVAVATALLVYRQRPR
jgi:hypothetical protein